MKAPDKRLSPAPTENQRRILASALARPAGEPIRQHARTVVATAHSGNNASYNAVWRCVRRGWLKAKRVAKNRVEIYLTGEGVTVLQPSSRQVIAAIGHALRYSEHRDDACDALEAIGYDATAFAADLTAAVETYPQQPCGRHRNAGTVEGYYPAVYTRTLRDRLTDGCDASDVATWSAVADAIEHLTGREP